MKRLQRPYNVSKRKPQSGLSLLEVMIAVTILLIVAVNVMALALTAITTTENQGHLAARTAEYAQDKMEQLMALAWGDPQTDTTVFPAAGTGGSGLSIGGSLSTTAPVTGYADYLDVSGNLLGGGATPPASWYYIRVWQISTPAGTTNLKQISVKTQVRYEVGVGGTLPQSTVVCMKANPF